ncbi:hypothetical protein [Streptomyces sp. QHH-9511]|uniref:hypothetical protein n=1 Tax=Streptomyces sp. QHH-9511 TaxID=2684468 RepID=UPI001E3C0BEF|nr:hypothetical protein [Streptomyces sp. QHH-9511]
MTSSALPTRWRSWTTIPWWYCTRPTGFKVRIGGIGDNFQLHTLLAHVLVGGGHVPGTALSTESVWLATEPEPARQRTDAVATGALELLAADGERIWNEELPDDIPVVEGYRLLGPGPPSKAECALAPFLGLWLNFCDAAAWRNETVEEGSEGHPAVYRGASVPCSVS